MVDSQSESRSDLHKQSLPGFSSQFTIRIQDVNVTRRKYIFEFGTPEGARAAFYLSASDRFTFLVTDIRGEQYPIEVAMGEKGVPLNKWIMLSAEVGAASDSTFLRILVPGQEVGHRTIPGALILGNRDWRLGAIGGDLGGKNNASFELAGGGIFTTTQTDENIGKLVAYWKDYLQQN